MKLFALSMLSALSLSSVALATPKVGDFANYALTMQNGGNSMNLNLSREILSQSGNSFVVRQIIQLPDGQQQTSESTEDASNFLSDATIEGLLTNCASAGGTMQSIAVPAGNFETCAVPFSNDAENGTVWIGRVSLGMVQIQTTSKEDGTVTNGQLTSFR